MDLKTHTDWDTGAFDRAPSAPAVGPFPRREFLRALSETLDSEFGAPFLVETDTALAAFSRSGGTIRFAGSSDLTDYHSPIGDGVPNLFERFLGTLDSGTRLDLDSLPIEASNLIARGFELAGVDFRCSEHIVSAVLELPPTFEDYLDRIGKKQRHELRRKRRRYVEATGELIHETHRGPGWAFDEFLRLHRLAPGEKGEFMTAETEGFFRRLVAHRGWRVDLLRLDGRAAACLFSYQADDGLYLYNSSYDPDLAEASPGVAMIGSMIEVAIGEGAKRFDFLKGDETYKFRLGAEARPLYRIEAIV